MSNVKNIMDLTGRVAVVVGGTSGLGRVLALGLADAGANVVVTGRRENMINDVATEIEARGRRTLRFAADVLKKSELEALRDKVLEEFGQVDILLNAAGRTVRRPTVDVTEEEWRSIMAPTLLVARICSALVCLPLIQTPLQRLRIKPLTRLSRAEAERHL